ncbi:MAG TPA: hypothetical protein VJ204_13350 [Solirubrobacterales bacterium]|nr:hypothetical protein [Solirubrobacterales bacterium]
MSAGSEQTEPATPTPPTPPSDAAAPSAMPSMAAFGSNETCPNCSARMAADQRYCLNCGHRRGDPRLPFMDAVVFMESMNSAPGGAGGSAPPPPPAQSGGSNNKWNANAALIAGVATLVLAIGVGFLIGRTGHNDNSSAGNGGGVKIVQLGGAGAGDETAAVTPEAESPTAGGGSETSTGSKGEGGKAKGKPAAKKSTAEKTKIKEGSEEETKAIEEAQNEVLHATSPQAKVGAQVGESCEKGTPGCEGEEFTGNFFGE